MLATSAELDFKLVKERIGVSDSVMSKQLKALESAGYVAITKLNHNGRPKTWISLTSVGRTAFESHVNALKSIIDV